MSESEKETRWKRVDPLLKAAGWWLILRIALMPLVIHEVKRAAAASDVAPANPEVF